MSAEKNSETRPIAKSVQWKGGNIIDVRALMHPIEPQYMGKQFSNADEIVGVPTPSGLQVAHLGDWITKNSDGILRVDKRGPEDAERLADECQRRADAVVDAAIAWHESGQEGNVADSLDAGELLTRAIEHLLALRSASDMPRRWCAVHNREEFKYESLEHELHAAECSCGTEKDSSGCPNGH